MSELPTVEKSPEQKILEEHGTVISCDRFSSKMEDGKPKWQPILIGTSIVCDGWESGKTTAVFSHFHEDHAWNFSRTLSNCHKVLLTETT